MSEIGQEVNSLLMDLVREETYAPFDERVHVTATTLSMTAGISLSKARRLLMKKAEAGELLMVKVVMPNRHISDAFCRK